MSAPVAATSATPPTTMPMTPSARALLSSLDATVVDALDVPEVVGVVVSDPAVSCRIGVGWSASGPPGVTGSTQRTVLPSE